MFTSIPSSLCVWGVLTGVRANAQQPKLFVGMMLILIFAEALGLYGKLDKRPQNVCSASHLFWLARVSNLICADAHTFSCLESDHDIMNMPMTRRSQRDQRWYLFCVFRLSNKAAHSAACVCSSRSAYSLTETWGSP